MSKLVVFYDLETTGLHKNTDFLRIIQIAARKIDLDTWEEVDRIETTLFNNGDVPINKGATEVHGISEDMVKGLPTFHEKAPEIFEFFQGIDGIGGYNNTYFDNLVLNSAFKKAGLEWKELRNLEIHDACTNYKRHYPCDQSSVYQFYFGRKFDNAHDAGADIDATVEIYKEQFKREQKLDEEDLHVYKTKHVDLLGDFKLRKDENGKYDIYYDFGKFNGKSIFECDPEYLLWMSKSIDKFPTDTCEWAGVLYDKVIKFQSKHK